MAYTFNVYRREKDDLNPPVAIATGLTSKNFTDNTIAVNKQYLYSIGATDGTTEKVGDEIEVSTTTGYFNTFENGDNLQFLTGVSYVADYSGDGVLISTSGAGNIIVRCVDSPDYYNFNAEFYVTFISGGIYTSSNLVFRNSEWLADYAALNYMLGVSRPGIWGYRRGSQFVGGNLPTQIDFNVRTKISVSAVDGGIKLFVNDAQVSDTTLTIDSYRGQFGFRFYCDGASSIRIEDLEIIYL